MVFDAIMLKVCLRRHPAFFVSKKRPHLFLKTVFMMFMIFYVFMSFDARKLDMCLLVASGGFLFSKNEPIYCLIFS